MGLHLCQTIVHHSKIFCAIFTPAHPVGKTICRLKVLWLADVQVFFKIFIYLLIYYVYNFLSVCMPTGQKRAPDPITDGFEQPCGCWKLNSGPLEEQSMLLTSEPSFKAPDVQVSLLKILC